MASTNDYPQVVDQSTLTGVFQADQFLAVGVEGQKLAGGTAPVATPQIIKDGAGADAAFGAGSPLALLCRSILGRGINYVVAVASAIGTTPTLPQRQAAWATLEDDPNVRIRLTDSTTQADLVALADSCEFAEGIQHKQFCVVGMPAATTKANLIAASTAIASKRAILVGPTIYDTNGVQLNGAFGAAWAAAEVAKNPDIVDSLNLVTIPATTGIEKEATTGLPIFRLRANGGAPVNDFQDLLSGGVSPFQQDPSGMAAFTHLRMTWTTDTTFDALQTLLIKDTVFLSIRDMLLDSKFLRIGNTAQNRAAAAKMVDQWLRTHSDWAAPVNLPDGTLGYGVTAIPGVDLKSFTISYFGQVVRGTNVININGTLTIPA